MRSMAELAKRARSEMEERRWAGVFLGSLMKPASSSVAPIMFSQATTARGLELLRASIALAMTGAMNFRILGPTAQVTCGELSVSSFKALFPEDMKGVDHIRLCDLLDGIHFMCLGVDGTVAFDCIRFRALSTDLGDSVRRGLLEAFNEGVHNIEEYDLV